MIPIEINDGEVPKDFDKDLRKYWKNFIVFCFHVYAQKSLFIGENVNFFLPPHRHPILLV